MVTSLEIFSNTLSYTPTYESLFIFCISEVYVNRNMEKQHKDLSVTIPFQDQNVESVKESASTVGSPSSTPRGGRTPEKEYLLNQEMQQAKETVTKWMRDTYKQPPR